MAVSTTTWAILGLGAVGLYGAYKLIFDTEGEADSGSHPRDEDDDLRGEGEAMFQSQDRIIVAMDAPDAASLALLNDTVAELKVQAPDIAWQAVPLSGSPFLSFVPIDDAIDKGPEIRGEYGVLLLGVQMTAALQFPEDVSFSKVNFVEVPPPGLTISPQEAAFLAKHRTRESRMFGLHVPVPRQPVAPFVAALLADLRNPSGLPADRTV